MSTKSVAYAALHEADEASARALRAAGTGLAETLQAGTAVLALGTATVVANITASTAIVLTRKTQGGVVTATVEYDQGTRIVGTPGSFVINADLASGAVNVADLSTINWIAVG